MVKLVGFYCGELRFKFCNDEFISCVSVIVIENDRMTKMHGRS